MAKKRQPTGNGKPDILALAMRRVYQERIVPKTSNLKTSQGHVPEAI